MSEQSSGGGIDTWDRWTGNISVKQHLIAAGKKREIKGFMRQTQQAL